MTDKSSSSSDPKTPSLHPAYTVTNIQNKVHTLDGTKVTYSSWVKLFKLHAKAYKVLDHIDGTAPPEEIDDNYSSWYEIDALILQWIYATLSDELMVRVLETDATARSTWIHLENIFLNNKGSRATTLEHDFTTLTLGACSSLDDYCQKLKEIANQLGDVGFPVSEARLVMRLVRGLPAEYEVTAAIINQNAPTWDEARTSLQREQQRQAAKLQQTQSVLVTPQKPTSSTQESNQNQPTQQPAQPDQYQNHSYSQNNYAPSRGRGRGRGYRGGRGRGRNRQQTNTWWQNTQHAPYSQQAPPSQYGTWHVPPSPYPSQAWAPSQPPSPYSQPQYNQAYMAYQQAQIPQPTQPVYSMPNMPPPPTAQYTDPNGFNALSPTDIGTALSMMQISPPDPTWNMDTGASSHITANPGSQDGQPSFAP
ncbi:putative RNA-directed DNA polymerase [Helianthus annuus]|nr:putative RNA-directed DNA polymerase [Helianthus annuus]KAJ0729206.1 putative RNA-directed DNA polymerase [Helianthus annuus]